MSWLDDVRNKESDPVAYKKAKRKGTYLAAALLVAFVFGVYFSFRVSAAPVVCDLTAGTLTCPVGTTPTPIPPIPPIPPVTSCTSADEQIAHKWGGGNQRVISQRFGNNVVSIKFTVPAGTSFEGGKQISVVEYQDGQATREMALSKVPCSFTAADAYFTGDGKWPAIQKGAISPGLNYGLSGNRIYVVTPGVPVYINIRNRDADGRPSCNSGATCNVAVTIRD